MHRNMERDKDAEREEGDYKVVSNLNLVWPSRFSHYYTKP